MTFLQFVAVIEGWIQNDIPFACTPKQGKNSQMDQDAMKRLAEIDDEDEVVEKDGESDYKELHFEGWDASALEGTSTKVRRCKPGKLSKTFPQWAHFVEILLAFYYLLVGWFYQNRMYALPTVFISAGFFWVSIPGIRTSVLKWFSECCCSNAPGWAEKETDETTTKKKNQKPLSRFSTVEDSDDSIVSGEGETSDSEDISV